MPNKEYLCNFKYCFAQLEDKQLALPSMEEQAAIEGNPTKLQTWTYKPANALMYVHHRRKIIICSFAYGKLTEFTFLFLDLRSSNGCLCNFLSCRVIVLFFAVRLTVFELDSFCVETATTTQCKFQWYYLNDLCTCNLIIEHVNDIPMIFVIINWACLERNCIVGYSLTWWKDFVYDVTLSLWCAVEDGRVVLWRCINWTWNKCYSKIVSHCADSQHWRDNS